MLLAAAGVLLSLAACSPSTRVVTSVPSEFVVPCDLPEDTEIEVDDLPAVSPVVCELRDVQVRFPDGQLVEIDAYSATGSVDIGDGRIYSFGSFDAYGLAVSVERPGEKRLWWGTPEGIRRLQYLEGLVDAYE